MSLKFRGRALPPLALLVLSLLLGSATASPGTATTAPMDEPAAHTHHDHMAAPHAATAVSDPHAHHRQAMDQIGYTRTTARYLVPTVALTTTTGASVPLEQLLDTDQPVALNFIFTSCTTICPIMSATFAQAQKRLGSEAQQIHWISISIDPEYDTPQRLHDYAQRFHAGAHWSFLTGDVDDIVALQRAFDVYRGDKMNHIPVTLLRAGRNAPWVRLHGLTSSSELVSEYRQLTPATR